MAIRIYTNEPPKRLLEKIRLLIGRGQITDWSYDHSGDFTHTAEHLKSKAWLRAEILDGTLRLILIGPRDADMSRAVYSAYHGAFVQMLFTHLPDMFTSTLCWAEEALLLEPLSGHRERPRRPINS
jgi:hypothetical protein